MLWESVPLVAVTLTLNVPVAALADVTFRVELPAPFEVSVIVEGLRLVVGPVGETEAALGADDNRRGTRDARVCSDTRRIGCNGKCRSIRHVIDHGRGVGEGAVRTCHDSHIVAS